MFSEGGVTLREVDCIGRFLHNKVRVLRLGYVHFGSLFIPLLFACLFLPCDVYSCLAMEILAADSICLDDFRFTVIKFQ